MMDYTVDFCLLNRDHTESLVDADAILNDPLCWLPKSLQTLRLDQPIVVKHGHEEKAFASLWRQCVRLIPPQYRQFKTVFFIDWNDELLSRLPVSLTSLAMAHSFASSSFSFSTLPRGLTHLDLSLYSGKYSAKGDAPPPALRSLEVFLDK